MSLVGLFSKNGANGFGYGSTAESVTEGQDLTGKTYLVTGCNSGLGAETTRVLQMRGAQVIGAARTLEKAQSAGTGLAVAAELSEPESVRQAVKDVQALGRPLDGIIANAGIMALPERTVHHGLELQFLTNHVGHFILVNGLLESLTETGRVVMLSSRAHERAYAEGIRLDDLDASKDYSAWGAYGQSKLANLLFANHLATRLPTGQTANSLHPGVIQTNLGRHLNPILVSVLSTVSGLLLKTIPQGAATQTFVATHPSLAETTGVYFSDCNPKTPSKHGQDATLAEALWEKTEALVAAL